MFVVIQTGGKQINVTSGQEIFVEKIIGQPKDKIIFDKVLMIGKNFGKPFLEKAEVHGKILKQDKQKKIKVFKYKPKKNSKTMYGHRQPYTKVLITDILLNGKSIVEKSVTINSKNNKEEKTEIKTNTSNNTVKELKPIENGKVKESAVSNVKKAKKVGTKKTGAKKLSKSKVEPEDKYDNTKTVISEGNVKTIFDHEKMTVKIIKEDNGKSSKK